MDEIETLEKELAKLRLKRKKFDELPVEMQTATKLHNCLCTYNHTDGCAWFYFEHDWTEDTHDRYLTKARRMISFSSATGVSPESLVSLIEDINKY